MTSRSIYFLGNYDWGVDISTTSPYKKILGNYFSREYIFTVTPEIPFFGKFVPKNQDFLLKIKFGTKISLNMLNSMVVFNFNCFGPEIATISGQIWSKKSALPVKDEI